MRKLLLGAAMAGGLYWASRQEGGIPGVFNRLQGKIKEVQDSDNPMQTIKESIGMESSPSMEMANTYTSLPEHQPVG